MPKIQRVPVAPPAPPTAPPIALAPEPEPAGATYTQETDADLASFRSPHAPGVELLEGDSLTLLPGMPDASFEVICTDPPHGLPVFTSGAGGGLPTMEWALKEAKMGSSASGSNRLKAHAQQVELVDWLAPQFARLLREDGYLYMCVNSLYGAAQLALEREGFKVRPWVWIKPNPAPSYYMLPWRYNVELALFAYRRAPLARRYSGGAPNWMQGAPPLGSIQRCHPTQKPVELFETWLRQTPGRMLDPFAGAGPSLLAAQRLGLEAVGVELEPEYAATIRSRLTTDPEKHWK